ncbi:hypothetical protein INR49_012757 [Caranx melampygus]|nr:hypothetical protein INR49_012757 [Caranx melampygus]
MSKLVEKGNVFICREGEEEEEEEEEEGVEEKEKEGSFCLGSGAPNREELELKLMAPLRLRTCLGTGLSRGKTGS